MAHALASARAHLATHHVHMRVCVCVRLQAPLDDAGADTTASGHAAVPAEVLEVATASHCSSSGGQAVPPPARAPSCALLSVESVPGTAGEHAWRSR